MMKKIILSLLLAAALAGCSAPEDRPAVIRINSITISAAEFESAFKNSPFSAQDTPASRKEFLSSYITRLLILKEAEKSGLDKDPAFLKNVESFWQQSLIKLVLDNKIKSIALSLQVSDADIRGYYDRHKETLYKDQSLASAYNNIKWLLTNQKQKEAMNAWVESLRSSAKVDIDYDRLKIAR